MCVSSVLFLCHLCSRSREVLLSEYSNVNNTSQIFISGCSHQTTCSWTTAPVTSWIQSATAEMSDRITGEALDEQKPSAAAPTNWPYRTPPFTTGAPQAPCGNREEWNVDKRTVDFRECKQRKNKLLYIRLQYFFEYEYRRIRSAIPLFWMHQKRIISERKRNIKEYWDCPYRSTLLVLSLTSLWLWTLYTHKEHISKLSGRENQERETKMN